MRKVITVVIRYECDVCKAQYPKVSDAVKCEKRILEKKHFAVGDRVRSLNQRCCRRMPKWYYAIGKVKFIHGPKLSNYDYETRHLGGKKERINAHIFVYIVEFICPHCDEKTSYLCYAPELIKLRNLRNRKTEKKVAHAR